MAHRKVAIVGGARSRVRAPFGDDSWEIWAFSSLRLPTPRITRWFEMHALGDLETQLVRSTSKRLSYQEYMSFLKDLRCPIYMQKVHADIPNSLEYPLERALHEFGRCFTSSVSYMIALAIMEGCDVIGVWGVHLTEKTVYAKQRPGVEYLLGVARQRGIAVYLPPESPLRIPRRPTFRPTKILYGYDWESPKAWWRKHLNARLHPKRVRKKRR